MVQPTPMPRRRICGQEMVAKELNGLLNQREAFLVLALVCRLAFVNSWDMDAGCFMLRGCSDKGVGNEDDVGGKLEEDWCHNDGQINREPLGCYLSLSDDPVR